MPMTHAGPLLLTTRLADHRPLGQAGEPVYLNHRKLAAVIDARLGGEAAGYLARPEIDQVNRRINWHAVVDGPVRRWVDLPPEERDAWLPRFARLQKELGSLARTLESAGGPGRAPDGFGRALRLALRSPGVESLYVVGDQLVLALWGFEGGESGFDTLTYQPDSPPAPVPPAAPAAPAAALAAAGAGRAWWRWLLWLLPLLLLLLLALLVLRSCFEVDIPVVDRLLPGEVAPDHGDGSRGAGQPPGGTTLVVPGPADGTAPGTVVAPGSGVVVAPGGTGAVETTPPAAGAGAADGGAVVDQGQAVPPPADQGASGQGASGQPPAAAGGDGKPPGDQGTAPGQPPPGTPPGPPAADQPGQPPGPQVEPPPGASPEPPPGGKPAEPPTEQPPPKPLTLPPAAGQADPRALGFLQGEWTSHSGLFDTSTGKPLRQIYRFDDKGQGTVVLRRADGVECQGVAHASRTPQGGLRIEEGGPVTCPDGRSYAPAITECTRDSSGGAQCRGVNKGGSSYQVQITR